MITERSSSLAQNLRLSYEDLEEAREVIRNAQVLVLQKEIPETTNVAAAKLAKGYASGISGCAGGCEPLFTFGHRRLEYSYRAHRCEPCLQGKAHLT